MYLFQTEQNAIWVFWVNKEVWNDEYKYIIKNCVEGKHVYLLVPTKQFGIVEFVCLSVADFNEQLEKIENALTL